MFHTELIVSVAFVAAVIYIYLSGGSFKDPEQGGGFFGFEYRNLKALGCTGVVLNLGI